MDKELNQKLDTIIQGVTEVKVEQARHSEQITNIVTNCGERKTAHDKMEDRLDRIENKQSKMAAYLSAAWVAVLFAKDIVIGWFK